MHFPVDRQPRPGYHFERVNDKPAYALCNCTWSGAPGLHYKRVEKQRVIEVEGEFDVTKPRAIQDNRKAIG